MNIKTVASELLGGCSVASLKEFIAAGKFPASVQIEGLMMQFWWEDEIIKWRDARLRSGDASNYSLGGRRRPKRNPKNPRPRPAPASAVPPPSAD